MEASNMYVTITSDEYEELKKNLERAKRLINNVSRENSEINRQNVIDTKTIVRLQAEIDALKTINGNLQKEIMDLRIKLGGKR